MCVCKDTMKSARQYNEIEGKKAGATPCPQVFLCMFLYCSLYLKQPSKTSPESCSIHCSSQNMPKHIQNKKNA